MRVLAGAVVALLAGGLLVAPPAHAEVAYPNPLPDFSHPNRPHAPLFRDRSDLPIPLLVVYATFNDQANTTEQSIEDRFFPHTTFKTVTNYFFANGLATIAPVVETFGEQNNGVVLVDLGASGPAIAQDAAERRRRMLDLADPFVDFARYDTNHNGSVEDSELAVFTIFTSRPGTDYCGQTRGVAQGRELDGKRVAFRTGDAGTATNRMTLAHELAHQVYELEDHYGFGVGALDIAGPTCIQGEWWFETNIWHRMHLGGQKPIVAVKDGYVDLSASSIGQAYLLYDPEKGTDDYFLVEARDPAPGTYDENASDSGLVVWRIDERNVRSGIESKRGVELIRPDGVRIPGCDDEDLDGREGEDPDNDVDDDRDGRIDEDVKEDDGNCYGGSDTDAWNPTDTRTVLRTMNAAWADGSPAKVAIRAIGRPFYADTSNEKRFLAYLDVRGPGILIDPARSDGNAPHPTVALGSTFEFTYPVRNTGEATDTFEFTVYGPDGWSATTDTMTLGPGVASTAVINVTVPTGILYDRTTLRASGRSTTNPDVRTDYQFLADIVKRPLVLTYGGDRSSDYSDPAQLVAAIRDGITAQPVTGKQVTFTVGTDTFQATTDAAGVARATWAGGSPGGYAIHVQTPEDALYRGGSTVAPFTVNPEKATVTVTSDGTQAAFGATLTLKAVQENDGHPGDLTKAGVTVTLTPTLGDNSLVRTAIFDAAGNATIRLNASADLWSVNLTTNGGFFSAPTVESSLALYDPGATLTGSALGRSQEPAARSGTQPGTTVLLTSALFYLGTHPLGTTTLTYGTKLFIASRTSWMIASGDKAILETTGTFNGGPAKLRATVTDKGPLFRDAFIVTISTPNATYTANVPTATGNLTVRTSPSR
ncbi:hypothetical protein GCM10009555_063970 [Acrocarpospora macrocephala]|uniref:EF-hand domain-containing protein n=1 Tax=Acrocarpospora macrocephala TaxID=150177 RepID=A0A5M3WMY1_9ACTN|nr:hypothetical protein Amac_012630 [Acrocarpospora macrocephala]